MPVDKYINGVKVQVLAPGYIRPELLFQGPSVERYVGRNWLTHTAPPGQEAPREVTLEDAIGVSALSLREIMNDDVED